MANPVQKIKHILFVCVENSCRSQMAEGFARFYGFDAESAGTTPSGKVDPNAVAVMREKGIDISGHSSKIVPADLTSYDAVITMGCCSAEELCPVFYHGRKIDWSVESPKGQSLEFYRHVRDEIEVHVKALKKGLEQEKC